MTRRRGTSAPFSIVMTYVLRGAELRAYWEQHRDEWAAWYRTRGWEPSQPFHEAARWPDREP